LQIKYQDKVYALVVFDWESFRQNFSLTERVYRALIAANVPEFQTDRHYSWSMLSSSRGFGYSSSDSNGNMPPTNLEASLQVHQSRERQMIEKQNQPFQ